MAKLIVAIEMTGTKAELEAHIAAHREDWFPQGTYIAVDEAELQRDPEESSFYAFEFRGVEE